MASSTALTVEQFFAKDGPLLRVVPGYKPRPEQSRLAETVEKVFGEGGALLADAPTGTGKSSAYLVPTMLGGKKVIVSTATKILQRQLLKKDLPMLAVLGELPQYYIGTCTSIIGQPNCVYLSRLSTGGPIDVAEGEKVRVIVLEDLKGETVTIGSFSPASEFEEFVPEAQKVLDSVEWRGS